MYWRAMAGGIPARWPEMRRDMWVQVGAWRRQMGWWAMVGAVASAGVN